VHAAGTCVAGRLGVEPCQRIAGGQPPATGPHRYSTGFDDDDGGSVGGCARTDTEWMAGGREYIG